MEQKQKDAEIDFLHLEDPQLPDQSEDYAKDEAFTQYLQFFESIFSDKTEPNYMASTKDEDQSKKERQASKQKALNYLERVQKRCYEKLRENQFHIARQTHEGQQKSELNSVPFQMKVIRHIVTWEVIELYCRLGPIFKKFIVLNSAQSLKENNQMYSNFKSSHGSINSNVYFLEFEQEPYVLKRVQFRKTKPEKGGGNDAKPPFWKVIKEYYIANLMSALQIGSQIKKVNGFDFIVHDSFIEFHMESCVNFDTASIEEQMKRNLLEMHSLKICHIDISPKNIMFSPTFKKWVFIDFGLSNMLKEKVDEKSYTGFCGTYEFCSSDMVMLFRRRSEGLVNLYLNDVWGLKESLKKMKKTQSFEQVEISQPCQIKMCQTLLDTYKKKYTKILSLLNKQMKRSDDSVFQNLTTSKKYHKVLIIRICKFLVYCKNIYFGGQQIDIAEIKYFKQTKRQDVLNMPQNLNHELKNFTKIFDFFLQKEQVIKFYQEFYNDTEELDEPIDIENEIKKWESFYEAVTLSRDQQEQTHQNNLFDFQKNAIDKFSDLALVQQSICNSSQIMKYLGYLFALVDFTSFKAFATLEHREKTFKTYFIIRTQLLQKILPSLKQFQTNSKFYPSLSYRKQCIPEILKFYDDILRVILESNKHSIQQSVQFEAISLILRHGFQILKNLIFLGFNCFQFIKDYLAILFTFLVKTEQLKKHLILIMVRQTIEIGLLLEQCEIIVLDGKNFSNISKHRLLNENIFYFKQHQQFKKLIEKNPILRHKMKLIQEMWIFLNPEYAKFMLSYKQFYNKFSMIEDELVNEFRSLNIDELIVRAKVYSETLHIVQKILDRIINTNEPSYGLQMTKFVKVNKTINQKTLDDQSENICNANLQYEQLVFGKDNIKSLDFPLKQLIRIDAHFLIKAKILSDHSNLIQTQKIIKKMYDICRMENLSTFVFCQEHLLLFYAMGRMKYFLSELYLALNIQYVQTWSVIGVLQKTVQMFRKYPPKKQLAFYIYLRLIWMHWMKAIEILAEQAKYWQKENVKVYQILYIRIAENTILLFRFFSETEAQYRLHILNNQQNRRLINRTIESYQTLSLLQQLESAMRAFEKNSLKDPKISVFNQCILFQIKQIYISDMQSLANKYLQEYIPNLSWIYMQLSRLHKTCWQSINFSSIGVRYNSYWYLTISNLLSKFQVGSHICRVRFLRFLSIQTMLKINYEGKSKVEEFTSLVKQIHNRSYMPESQNFLIHFLVIAYFHDINLYDSKIDIMSFQNTDQAIGNAIFYFREVSQNLNRQLLDYLVENIIKLKHIPLPFTFYAYLKLFKFHQQYFDRRKKKKLFLLWRLFSMLINNGVNKYKEAFLSQLYYQYQLCYNLVKLDTAYNLDIYHFTPYIIRKIITNYTKRPVFAVAPMRSFLKSFIQLDQSKVNEKIKNKNHYKIISKKLLNKRFIYIGMQFTQEWEGFNYTRKRNQLDYQQFQSFIETYLSLKEATYLNKKQSCQILKYLYEQKRRDMLVQIEKSILESSNLSYQYKSEFDQKVISDQINKIKYGDRPIHIAFPQYFGEALRLVSTNQSMQYYQHVKSTYQKLFSGNQQKIRISVNQNLTISERMVKYVGPIKKFMELKSKVQRQIEAFGLQQDIVKKREDDFKDFLRLKRYFAANNYQI